MRRFFSVDALNKDIQAYWKLPRYKAPTKAELARLTEEMLKDPQYKGKVWVPFTALQVAEHLSNYRNVKDKTENETNGNGC